MARRPHGGRKPSVTPRAGVHEQEWSKVTEWQEARESGCRERQQRTLRPGATIV